MVNHAVPFSTVQTRLMPTPLTPPTQPTPPFHVMLKPRGAICNLDCSYCYYLAKEDLYPGSSFHMSDEVLDSFTRQYIQAQPVPEVVFGWQGGEPLLMGLDFFRRAVSLQERYGRPGTRVLNTIQTNGVGLDHDWCQFFREKGFLVGLSLDGPMALHDAYRLDKGGNPTFSRVLAGLELLRTHGVEWNILATVHAANAPHPVEVYRFLRDDADAEFIQFIPIVERGAPEQSVSGEAYGDFLMAVFEEWVRRDVGRVFVQMFDVALAKWVGHPAGLCIFDETCGRALALEHNGDLYACDHFVTPDFRLGNLRNQSLTALVSSPKQGDFGRTKATELPPYCLECEVRFACNGGCPKNRFGLTPQGDPGLNVLCSGYRAFFYHIGPTMEVMAGLLREGRAPAEIMSRGRTRGGS